MSEQTPGDPSAVPESRTAPVDSLCAAIQAVILQTRDFNERKQEAHCRVCRLHSEDRLHDPECSIYRLHAWLNDEFPKLKAALASSASVSSPPSLVEAVRAWQEASAELGKAGDPAITDSGWDVLADRCAKAADAVRAFPLAASVSPPASVGQPPRGETTETWPDDPPDEFTPEQLAELRASWDEWMAARKAALHSGLIPALRELSEQLKQEDFHDTCSARLDRILARFP